MDEKIRASCEICVYYKPVEHQTVGFCLKNPPQLVVIGTEVVSRWPVIGPGERCGEWKLRE